MFLNVKFLTADAGRAPATSTLSPPAAPASLPFDCAAASWLLSPCAWEDILESVSKRLIPALALSLPLTVRMLASGHGMAELHPSDQTPEIPTSHGSMKSQMRSVFE